MRTCRPACRESSPPPPSHRANGSAWAAIIGIITEVFGDSATAFDDIPHQELAALAREAIADLLPGAVGAPA